MVKRSCTIYSLPRINEETTIHCHTLYCMYICTTPATIPLPSYAPGIPSTAVSRRVRPIASSINILWGFVWQMNFYSLVEVLEMIGGFTKMSPYVEVIIWLYCIVWPPLQLDWTGLDYTCTRTRKQRLLQSTKPSCNRETYSSYLPSHSRGRYPSQGHGIPSHLPTTRTPSVQASTGSTTSMYHPVHTGSEAAALWQGLSIAVSCPYPFDSDAHTTGTLNADMLICWQAEVKRTRWVWLEKAMAVCIAWDEAVNRYISGWLQPLRSLDVHV